MIVCSNFMHGMEIAKAAGTTFNPAVDQVIARVENGELYGGNIYTGYTGASIQLHMAGFRPNWANREFLRVAFDYPFNQLGCERVFGQIPESNVRALEIDLKLGFKVVARVEGVFEDGACIVVAMERSACRWIGPRLERHHGRQEQGSGASRLFAACRGK